LRDGQIAAAAGKRGAAGRNLLTGRSGKRRHGKREKEGNRRPCGTDQATRLTGLSNASERIHAGTHPPKKHKLNGSDKKNSNPPSARDALQSRFDSEDGAD
jgi:hypothetical protein